MMADKDVEVSEVIMSPSPVPKSVFVAGHQLESLAARPTDSGFHVCSVNCQACDARTTNNHRVCSVNCRTCMRSSHHQPTTVYVV